MSKQQEIDALRVAISWLEHPFVDETASHDELKARVRLMLEDVRRINRAKNAKVSA